MRDAPSITLVNMTIDLSFNSHIIRQRSSHVSGFGPKYPRISFELLKMNSQTLSSDEFIRTFVTLNTHSIRFDTQQFSSRTDM